MRVTLNGEERELAAGATIVQAVEASGASAERGGIAVAVDGEVVPRGGWGVPLEDGQQVEVLQAVQGG